MEQFHLSVAILEQHLQEPRRHKQGRALENITEYSLSVQILKEPNVHQIKRGLSRLTGAHPFNEVVPQLKRRGRRGLREDIK